MKSMSMTQNKEEDLDFVLEDIGGAFGKFQISMYILLAVPLFLSDAFGLDYVFSTMDLDYRCRIPECEPNSTAHYHPDWIENAVPLEKSKPMRCMRYEPISDFDTHPEFGSCDATAFNRSTVVTCSSGEFVYRTDDVSVVNEFNITCEDSNWKLSLIGVTSNVARLIFMPIFGNLSDRIGRVPVLIISVCGTCIFKFLSTFSVSYQMFLILTFFDAGACSALYPTAFILGMEWATTKKRILVSSMIMFLNPFGSIVTAFVASQTHNYKWMLRIISLPGLLLISYIWLTRESLRWLLVKKKYDRAMETVGHVTKVNEIVPSQRTLDIIESRCKSDNAETKDDCSGHYAQLRIVLTSSKLIMRLAICIIGWITSIFIIYGISVVSVSLPGDKYWNFSLVSLATVPPIFSSYFMLTYMRRRWTLCVSLIISGVTIIASNYVGHFPTLALILFLLGKSFIRHSVMVIYVYTGELWPTSLRHTILSICSMFGRIGSTVAPMLPLMAQYSESLPFFLFFGTAVLSGLLFLFMPETFETILPDTIQEAQSIGTKKKIACPQIAIMLENTKINQDVIPH